MSGTAIVERAGPAAPPLGESLAGRVCVGIATRGRPAIVAAVIERLGRQSLQPCAVIVAATAPEDVTGLPDRPGLTVLIGAAGLARQRNAILRAVPEGTEIVAFFDDDFVTHDDWLAAVVATFRQQPGVACVTGTVAADGILGPGIAFEEACALADASLSPGADLVPCSPYGCNMAFRCSAIGSLRFDERLVLYGWLEDYDFGSVLARHGWGLVRAGAARGVHMGIKSGRMPGCKLGYSQIMNPAYLLRKGTGRWSTMAHIVARNVTSNLVKSLRPEPYVDRWGRLRGNAIAVLDLCRGRLTPERAETL